MFLFVPINRRLRFFGGCVEDLQSGHPCLSGAVSEASCRFLTGNCLGSSVLYLSEPPVYLTFPRCGNVRIRSSIQCCYQIVRQSGAITFRQGLVAWLRMFLSSAAAIRLTTVEGNVGIGLHRANKSTGLSVKHSAKTKGKIRASEPRG